MSALTRIITGPAGPHWARRLSVWLARVLVLIAGVALALPVALLPFTTAVPPVIWVPLALADLVLVAALFWFHWTPPATGVVLTGQLLLAVAAVIASQLMAATP